MCSKAPRSGRDAMLVVAHWPAELRGGPEAHPEMTAPPPETASLRSTSPRCRPSQTVTFPDLKTTPFDCFACSL